ncbi:hypothetical protein L5515_006826 [Caenorhabditis briggsae]|uniref:Serpentine Receptor, class H n=1 Tax=Caenorhabditis briggsae TaxID=6238 RepID=A0AAE9F1C5_CAEBR|nr:hypothetical protein L5515_006826 [Caenorhabditis briggsae]
MEDCSLEASYLASPDFMILACHVLAGVQFPVFIFGTYGIIFKTPPHMANVKWLLLNTHFWSSLSDSIICSVALPYLFIPTLAGFNLGVMNNPGLAIYCIVTTTTCSGVSILAIYENRYYMLFGRKTWWRHFRKPYFTMVYLLAPCMFLPPLFNVPEQESARNWVLRSIPCLPNYTFENRKMYVLALDFMLPVGCVMVELIILVPPFVTFLSLTFWNIWMSDAWTASKQTVCLQKAFTKGVTVQTVYEFFILFVPVCTIIFMLVFWHHNQIINNFALLIISLNGVGSTIIMLFAHRPYRDFTISVLCCCFPKKRQKRESIRDNFIWKSQMSMI